MNLGVDDEAFLRAVYRTLRAGGLFVVYNLSPAQNPPDKPYLPWADGRFPFDRELVERVGFEILAFDADDSPAARELGGLLEWDKTGMDLKNGLFAHYTVLRRPE